MAVPRRKAFTSAPGALAIATVAVAAKWLVGSG